MNSSFLMTMTAIATFGIGLLILTSEPKQWVDDTAEFFFPEPDPVLVVIVGNRDLVGSLRGVIEADRILADTGDAFALDSRRVIAANADAASGPINQLDWIERKIEIVSVPTDGGRQWERDRGKRKLGKGGSPEDQAKAEKIASLMNKPTLNAGEAMMLLNHMDSAGQF
ncbi:MAG: hypothetical protein QF570_21490 [Myxococcota bacterium]|jgi:hypothetical protein|nr:hypothetical protein [Myxococcota bacterium]